MATATYKRGEKLILDYTAGATIAVDEVVTCGTNGEVSVGIAQMAGVSGDTMMVDVGGVYEFPKLSAAVIVAGETVDWDASEDAVNDNQNTATTGDVVNFGIALESAGNGVTTVKVKLKPGTSAIS